MSKTQKAFLLFSATVLAVFAIFFSFKATQTALDSENVSKEKPTTAGDTVSENPSTALTQSLAETKTENTKPNIVLIYADDVDCETVFGQFPQQNSDTIQFPNLKSLAKDGVRFSNFHVTTAACGPSRACLYSGQYAHRNQCRVNQSKDRRSLGFKGGFSFFDPTNELAIWMKNSGYETAHVGKYLHDGFKPNPKSGINWADIVPPGWDHFEVSLGDRYYNYKAYSKAKDKISTADPETYRTDEELDRVVEILDLHLEGKNENKTGKSNRPLLLCWSPVAAHPAANLNAMAAKRHSHLYQDSQPPGFNTRLNRKMENEVTELQGLPIPNDKEIAARVNVYQSRMRAMQSLDENVGRLRRELESRAMLDNTVFIFTSDHGFRYLQHRHLGKRLPYDRISRVPFVVAGPGIPKDIQCSKLLANIDIAPTLVDLASGKTPQSCDGQTFLPLLYDPGKDTDVHPQGILIENWGEAVSQRAVVPATYSSLRMNNSIYTEWATGGREFFDLASDPEQFENSFASLSDSKAQKLSQTMKDLRTDNVDPAVTILPIKGSICGTITPALITGYAEFANGIKSVELELKCSSTGQFWDGVRWIEKQTRVVANLDQPNGLITRWRYPLNTKNYASSDPQANVARNVSLTAFGIGGQDRKAISTTSGKLKISFLDPETTITSIRFDKKLHAEGRAMDLVKINMVRIAIRNVKTFSYWNGTDWQKEFFQFDTKVTQDSFTQSPKQYSWSASIDLGENKTPITIIARAYNKFGDYDDSAAIQLFTPTG